MELAELKQKRKEFLEDTYKYYAEDVSRRAVEENSDKAIDINFICSYRTMDGRRCAIGRHIPDELYDPSIEGRSIWSSTMHGHVPKNLLGLGVDFL